MMLLWFAGACRRGGGNSDDSHAPYVPGSELPEPAGQAAQPETGDQAQAVFAGGCFWCTEAVFEQLKGVKDVVSGYAGGTATTADYRTVSSGETDHAEVIRITYDPHAVTFGQLLRVFFATHDPTQLNRQGPDTGRQYRSAVFYADEQQKQIAAAYIEQLNQSGSFDQPIVTTLEPLDQFYEAEEYHQDYARRNPGNPYIQYNALPKVEKLRQKFPDKLKGE